MPHARALLTRLLSGLVAGTLAAGGLLTLAPAPAQAAEILVTSDADSGAGSLREALETAAASPGADTITFSLAADQRTIVLASPLAIDDADALTVDGGGVITLDGGGTTRILTADGQARTTLRGLTLANGFEVDGGGAITSSSSDELVLDRITVTGSRNDGQQIGAFGAVDTGGATTVIGSVFTNNRLAARNTAVGGAIYARGPLTVSGSTFEGNATAGSNSAVGGAIFTTSALAVMNSTFAGNATTAGNTATGGAIYSNGAVSIANSTFVGNRSEGVAAASGGAVGTNDQLILIASTFTQNAMSPNGSSGIAAAGRGLTAAGVLAAGNSATDLFSRQPITSVGGNVVGTTQPALTGPRDRTGVGMADAFGTTSPSLTGNDPRTVTLGTQSVAINRVPAGLASYPSTDQRGVSRPQKGAPDAGAYEYDGPDRTVSVAPATLPEATAGTAYSQQISASGGVAPYTYAVTAGSLPSGLTLSGSGELSGTPRAPGSSTFTITATDDGVFRGSRAYSLTVNAATIVVSPPTLPDATVGTAYSQQLTAAGGTAPYSYAVTAGGLPPGVTLSAGGQLSGTPRTNGTFTFMITAADSSQSSGTRSYTVTVARPDITVSPASVPSATAGVAYSQTLTASGGTAPHTFAVTGGALPAGLTLSSAGQLTGTPRTSGSFAFTVTAVDSGSFTGSRAYTLTVAQPTITVAPASIPGATQGVAYSQQLTASGGSAPYGFAVTAGALPTGVTLSAAGELTGTPRAAGSYPFSVSATDGGGFSGTRSYTLAVSDEPPVVTASAGETSYVDGAGPVAVDDALTLTSTASVRLASGSVALTSGFAAGQDQLALPTGSANTGNITASYDASTGVLQLTSAGASATIAEWQSALRAVTYTNTSSDPSTTDRVATFRVTDDRQVMSGPATRRITVTARNDAPVAADDAYTVAEDDTLTVTATDGVLANDTDPEDDPLSADLLTGPQHGTLTLQPGGAFTYTPDADYNGADTFTYRAGDGTTFSTAATVTLEVTGVDDRPVARDDRFTATGAGGVGGTGRARLTVPARGVLDNDTDVDDPAGDLRARLGTAPAHGTVTLDPDGSFSYMGEPGYAGDDTFTYTVAATSHPSAASAPASVTISVDAGDAPPTITDLEDLRLVTGRTSDPASFEIGDADDDAGALTLSAASSDPGVVAPDSITLAGSGTDRTVTVAARPGSPGTTTITLTVTDPDGASTSTRFDVTVTDPPLTPGRCTIVGTPGDDVLVGTAGDDVICGRGGDDTIRGGDGDDVIEAGAGQDTVIAGDGDDRVSGGAGDDTLRGRAGRDRILGGIGADRLYGDTGPDVLRGGAGDDRLFGGPGYDDLRGGTGDDLLDGGPGRSSVAR